jgi:hypothetical protein
VATPNRVAENLTRSRIWVRTERAGATVRVLRFQDLLQPLALFVRAAAADAWMFDSFSNIVSSMCVSRR